MTEDVLSNINKVNNNPLEVRMMKGTKYLIIGLLCLGLAIFAGCGDSTSSDKTPPTVSIAQPVQGATYTIGNTVNVTINADDNEQVRRVEFMANGELITTLTTSPYTYQWVTSNMEAGDCSLVAKAVDKSGNSTNSTPVEIQLRRPNTVPEKASNPNPANGAETIPVLPTLSWESSDADGDELVYDVYYGTSSTLPDTPISDNQTETSFTFAQELAFETTYYWRIDVYDGTAKKVGDVWHFKTTMGENLPPVILEGQYPADGETGLSPSLVLNWSSQDPENSSMFYDLYFGTDADPVLIGEDLSYSEYTLNQLQLSTTYYWKIVVTDGYNQVTGPVWSFSTNFTPPVPSNPFPADDAIGVANSVTLTWDCEDQDENDEVSYKVYFGTQPNPVVMSYSQTANSYEATSLLSATTYYWKIEANDGTSASTSPTWHFRTNTRPEPITNPYPENGADFIFLDVVLSWECSDLDGDDLTYNVQMGTGSNFETIAEGLTEKSFAPTGLQYDETYYWRVLAFDGSVWRTGTTWLFDTIDAPNVAPLEPSSPYPEDMATDTHTSLDFQWACSDPNTGQPLTYSFYIGTDSNPPVYAEGLTDTTYTVEQLETSTTYYWKVVASDNALETSSPVWSFTTGIMAGSWSMEEVGSCNVMNGIYGFDYNEGYIYAADRGAGMLVINATNPNSPTVNGLINTPNYCYDVFYYNNTAYSVDLEWGMQINSVTNPVLPQYVGYGTTPGNAEGIWVEGNYAYVADAEAGLQIFDLTDPTTPTIVGNIDTDGSAHQVCVVGNYAYVADMTNGIVIVDVTDPTNPSIASTTATSSPATDVYSFDDVLYACTSDGFYAYSISSPSQLSELSNCSIVGTPMSCYVKDNFAVIAADEGGVSIVNVTNTSNVAVVQQTNDDGLTSVKDVRFDNNHIFISNGDNGFVVLKIFE